MGEFITRKEHDEFVKRMEDEHNHIREENKLLRDDVQEIKKEVKANSKLIIAVHDIAQSTKKNTEELEKQSNRLAKLEEVPVKNWNTAKTAVITTVIGSIVGIVIGALGF